MRASVPKNHVHLLVLFFNTYTQIGASVLVNKKTWGKVIVVQPKYTYHRTFFKLNEVEVAADTEYGWRKISCDGLERRFKDLINNSQSLHLIRAL